MGFDMVECGLRLKAIRIERGLTQEELAEKMNMSRSHLGMIETGKTGPSIDLLVQFADVLDTSTDYLLLGKKDSRTKLETVKKVLRSIIQVLLELVDSL